VVLLKTMTICF